MSQKISLEFDKKKALLLSLSLLIAFSGSVSAYQEPNITEVKDSFGDTYQFDNTELSPRAVSNREIRFGQNESLEVCVTEVEHEEGAELEFRDAYNGYGPLSFENRCVSYNLSEEYYNPSITLRIEVEDTNPSRTFSNHVYVEYNNTVDPLENYESQESSTSYDYTLIKTDQKNELEENISQLRNTVQAQESEIESLEEEISNKDEKIASLKQEISNLKSGISGIIRSLFN